MTTHTPTRSGQADPSGPASEERLFSITSAIAAAVTEREVFSAVVDEVGTALGASSAGLWLVRDNRTAELVSAYGYTDATKPALTGRSIDDEGAMPILDTMRLARPIFIGSQRELLDTYPHLEPFVSPHRRYRISCLPMIVDGHVIGGLGFTFENAPPADEHERDFLVLVAGYCAQAIERLRLLEGERLSRKRAEASAARMALLSRASRAFSEVESELAETLRTIVEEVNREFAEASGITLLPEHGETLAVAAVAHREPDGTDLMRALLASSPVKLNEGISGRVAATGRPILMPRVDPALFDSPAYAPYRPFFERWTPASVLAVPLRVHGRILGTLSAVRGQEAPPFDEDDQILLQELSERAALAIERGRLQTEMREARARAELMYRLAAGLIAAGHVDQLCETALDGLQSALGAERSSILALDDRGVMRFRAWRGLSEAYRAAVDGHSPWAANHVDPEPILVSDVETDRELEAHRETFRAENVRALMFFPLVAQGRLLGKLMVYYAEPRSLSEAEMDMARAIANHVAAALARFSAMEELERTVRFNEMFTGMLGHDLRNPLGAIMNAAQLALLRQESERLRTPLSRIMSAGSRMSRMIDQLLDFTRIRVGSGIRLVRTRLDIRQVLTQVMNEIETSAPEWTIRLESQGDLQGCWDADRLSQVFSNLLGNALQHGVREHGCTVRLDGSAPHELRIEVSNRGTIGPDVLPHIFEPMTGGGRRPEASHGLGLGLYISERILDAHGGRIEVSSADDDATTFSAILPRDAESDEQGR